MTVDVYGYALVAAFAGACASAPTPILRKIVACLALVAGVVFGVADLSGSTARSNSIGLVLLGLAAVGHFGLREEKRRV